MEKINNKLTCALVQELIFLMQEHTQNMQNKLIE